MNDPAPGPGITASLSSGSWVDLGSIELVPSMGVKRWATYREIYLTNPWVWAAVNLQARGMARLPLGVFERDAEGDKQRIRSDVPGASSSPGVELDRLIQTPQDGVSRGGKIGATIRDKLIYGNGLWTLERPAPGLRPTAAIRRPWRKVARVQTDADDRPLYYELTRRPGDLEPRRFLPADVVHFGLGSDEGALGISPLSSCRATLALHNAVVRHLLGYFGNSARTSGHLAVDKLTPSKAKEIRDMITEVYTSPENAGKVLVTSGKWEATSDSPDHSQVVELIMLSREETAAAYGIPPPILGILDRAIKSNVKELREQYVRDGLGPLAADTEDELQAQLLYPAPAWQTLFTEFQLAEQLRPDLEARALVYQRSSFWLTIDDIRKLENLPPLRIAGVTDVPWSVSGSQPISAWKDGQNPTRRVAPAPAPAGPARARALGADATLDLLGLLELELAETSHTNGNGSEADS